MVLIDDINFTGDLEMHIKWGGDWLMKTKKPNVSSKELLKSLEELSIACQRAIDTTVQGRPEKNIIPTKNFDDNGVKDN